MVYATDASGSVTLGSLQTLRAAVNNGSSVRVIITAPNDSPWGLLCTNTSLRIDSSQAVVCRSDQDVSINFAMGAQFGTVSNSAYSAHFLLNTSDHYVHANMNVKAGNFMSTTIYNYPMRWYVD